MLRNRACLQYLQSQSVPTLGAKCKIGTALFLLLNVEQTYSVFKKLEQSYFALVAPESNATVVILILDHDNKMTLSITCEIYDHLELLKNQM
jgi:hypothetical protein